LQGNWRLGTTTVVCLTKNGLLASDSRDNFQGGRTSLFLPPGAENPSYATVNWQGVAPFLWYLNAKGPTPLEARGGALSCQRMLAFLLLWPNGLMHQNATWYGGRPQPRRLCVTCGPSPQ